jgi:hypothetical protein
MAGFDERLDAADRAMSRTHSKGDTYMSDPAIHGHEAHMSTRDRAELRAREMKSDAELRARGASARAKYNARNLRDRLNDGIGQMSEEGRRRVVSARLAAIEAQHSVEDYARNAAATARRSAHDNPLMLGIVALGIGAAIGAALPRSSAENHALGAHRDRLMDEADRVFREEMSKLRRVAEAAVAEGKSAAKDTIETGPPSEDNPGKRVSDAAEAEAQRQKVGSIG